MYFVAPYGVIDTYIKRIQEIPINVFFSLNAFNVCDKKSIRSRYEGVHSELAHLQKRGQMVIEYKISDPVLKEELKTCGY